MSGVGHFRANDYPGPMRVPLVESLQTSRCPVGSRLQSETIFPRRQRECRTSENQQGLRSMYRPSDVKIDFSLFLTSLGLYMLPEILLPCWFFDVRHSLSARENRF